MKKILSLLVVLLVATSSAWAALAFPKVSFATSPITMDVLAEQEVTINLSKHNYALSSLQMNITLSEDLSYVEGSAALGTMADDAELGIQKVEGQNKYTVQILAKATGGSQKEFTGDNSDILTFKVKASTIGAYTIKLDNIIGSTTDATRFDLDDVSGTIKAINVVCKNTTTNAIYDNVQEAVNAVTADETIQMVQDYDLTSTINVATTTPAFTLDLNGHVLNAGNLTAPTQVGAKANVIYNEGTLTIIDSNPTATHTGDLSAVTGGVLTGGKGYHWPNNPHIYGGGIYNKGTLTMTGGTITGNSASYNGGGIFVDDGSLLTLNGDTKIINNTSDCGGGIGTSSGTTVNLYGCTITGNKAGACGGIEVWLDSSAPTTYNIGGKVVIKDNYLTDGTTKSDVGIYDGGKLTISSTTPLDAGSEIGILTFNYDEDTNPAIAAQFTTNGTADDKQYFFVDDDYYVVAYNAEGQYLELLDMVGKVILKIDAIGEVLYSEECKARIDDARSAYDALDESMKPLVTNYQTLLDAEAKYQELKNAAERTARINNVIKLINAIGTVTYTPECKARIDLARNAYDELPEIDKRYVTNYNLLVAAEEEYRRLEQIATGIVNVNVNVNVNKDGKYLENGKVVILKNGKKFTTSGQQIMN